METREKRYTIVVFTENNFGLLNRITIIFSRRRINIESMTVSETERKGISRFTIVIVLDNNLIKPLIKQIRKIIGVLSVFQNEEDQVITSQIAFYKIATKNPGEREKVMDIALRHHCRITFSNDHYLVVEKTGNEDELLTMLHLFEPHNVQEFVKSGRVAVVRNQQRLEQYAKNLEPEGWYSLDEFHENNHTKNYSSY
jgi:acetolactate synthase I/III small subunit